MREFKVTVRLYPDVLEEIATLADSPRVAVARALKKVALKRPRASAAMTSWKLSIEVSAGPHLTRYVRLKYAPGKDVPTLEYLGYLRTGQQPGDALTLEQGLQAKLNAAANYWKKTQEEEAAR